MQFLAFIEALPNLTAAPFDTSAETKAGALARKLSGQLVNRPPPGLTGAALVI